MSTGDGVGYRWRKKRRVLCRVGPVTRTAGILGYYMLAYLGLTVAGPKVKGDELLLDGPHGLCDSLLLHSVRVNATFKRMIMMLYRQRTQRRQHEEDRFLEDIQALRRPRACFRLSDQAHCPCGRASPLYECSDADPFPSGKHRPFAIKQIYCKVAFKRTCGCQRQQALRHHS